MPEYIPRIQDTQETFSGYHRCNPEKRDPAHPFFALNNLAMSFMSGFKYYLIASLPAVRWGERAPMPSAGFVETCREWLPCHEFNELLVVDLVPLDAPPSLNSPVAIEWSDWETSLRNKMARARAKNANADPSQYFRGDLNSFSKNIEQDHDIEQAFSAPNPLEKERLIDMMRWRKLDALEAGRFFDFEKLCVYKLKLMLCEKWDARNRDAGNLFLKRLSDKIG